jgi:Na+-translocating ferredoxin:NAD+ oxidoreductase RnfA subunit
MQPFTVILGVVFGSLFSIAFSLSVVLFVFWFLQGEHPRFDAEMPALFRSTSIFLVLAALSALSFLGTLRGRIWRYPCLVLLWLGIAATGWVYWPA